MFARNYPIRSIYPLSKSHPFAIDRPPVGLLYPELHNERLTSLSALFFVSRSILLLSFFYYSKKERRRDSNATSTLHSLSFFLSLTCIVVSMYLPSCLNGGHTQENDRASERGRDVGQSDDQLSNTTMEGEKEKKKKSRRTKCAEGATSTADGLSRCT